MAEKKKIKPIPKPPPPPENRQFSEIRDAKKPKTNKK